MEFHTITVAVDGSAASSRALDWAADQAGRSGAVLEIVTVAGQAATRVDYLDEALPAAELVLFEALDAVRGAAPELRVRTRCIVGDTVRELVKQSERSEVLVIGLEGATTGRRRGAVALRLAALSRCTLVVVPSGWTPTDGPVLLGVGYRDPHEAAVAFAATEAGLAGAPLQLVHAWSRSDFSPFAIPVAADTWRDAAEADLALLELAADTVRRSYPGLRVTTCLSEGATVPCLMSAAARAQLLVVGRGGMGFLHELAAMGSIASDLLSGPPAPVAIVTHPRRRAEQALPLRAFSATAAV